VGLDAATSPFFLFPLPHKLFSLFSLFFVFLIQTPLKRKTTNIGSWSRFPFPFPPLPLTPPPPPPLSFAPGCRQKKEVSAESALFRGSSPSVLFPSFFFSLFPFPPPSLLLIQPGGGARAQGCSTEEGRVSTGGASEWPPLSFLGKLSFLLLLSHSPPYQGVCGRHGKKKQTRDPV